MTCWNKEELENMLEDVVNELDLSDAMIQKHGHQESTPAELVRLVLRQKDKQIRMLKAGMIAFGGEQIMTKPILDPDLVYKLVDDIFETYQCEGDEYLLETLIELGLMTRLILTEEDIQENKMPWIQEYDMEVGDEYYSYTLEEITEKLQTSADN